jgi:hypothetical protein
MSCNICCDNYNKSTRTKICCPYCEFDVCRTCCETYILSENIPKCMKPECAKEWTRKFLRENFTNVFLTSKYKQHLEDVLFDQEKSLLPATQPLVEEKKAKEIIKKQIGELNKLIDSLHKQKRALEYQYYNYGITSGQEDEKATRAQFIRQCPANNCRGFLSSQWKCGLCEQWSCPDCHELKGLERDCEHTCDPNNVETAKMLAKDSKPCPKCQSLIFKVSGCDQMWCTQCHTAFSWKTGRLETHIHNPHFYEWQRAHGGGLDRAPGDIECGRELNSHTGHRFMQTCKKHPDLYNHKTELHKYKLKINMNFYNNPGYENLSTDFKGTYSDEARKIVDIIRNTIHNNHVELPNFQTDYVARNQDLRIRYLENEISDEEFKTQIQRNDKKNRNKREVAQILQLASTTVTDIIYRCIDNFTTSHNGGHNINLYLEELQEIRNYCNNIFRDIAFTYNTVQYGFNDVFSFIRIEKEKKEKKEKKEEKDDPKLFADDTKSNNTK